jgi:hypothetical protein
VGHPKKRRRHGGSSPKGAVGSGTLRDSGAMVALRSGGLGKGTWCELKHEEKRCGENRAAAVTVIP